MPSQGNQVLRKFNEGIPLTLFTYTRLSHPCSHSGGPSCPQTSWLGREAACVRVFPELFCFPCSFHTLPGGQEGAIARKKSGSGTHPLFSALTRKTLTIPTPPPPEVVPTKLYRIGKSTAQPLQEMVSRACTPGLVRLQTPGGG